MNNPNVSQINSKFIELYKQVSFLHESILDFFQLFTQESIHSVTEDIELVDKKYVELKSAIEALLSNVEEKNDTDDEVSVAAVQTENGIKL